LPLLAGRAGAMSAALPNEAAPTVSAAMLSDKAAPIAFIQDNPKRTGSKAYDRFERYKKTRTIGDAYREGALRGDIINDVRAGYATLQSESGARSQRETPAPYAEKERPADKRLALHVGGQPPTEDRVVARGPSSGKSESALSDSAGLNRNRSRSRSRKRSLVRSNRSPNPRQNTASAPEAITVKDLVRGGNLQHVVDGLNRGFPACCTLSFAAATEVGAYDWTSCQRFASRCLGALMKTVSGIRLQMVLCNNCTTAVVEGDVHALIAQWRLDTRLAVAAAGNVVFSNNGQPEGLTTEAEKIELLAIVEDLVSGMWRESRTVAAALALLTVCDNHPEVSAKLSTSIAGCADYHVPTSHNMGRHGVWAQIGGRQLPFVSTAAAVAAGATKVCMHRSVAQPPPPELAWRFARDVRGQ